MPYSLATNMDLGAAYNFVGGLKKVVTFGIDLNAEKQIAIVPEAVDKYAEKQSSKDTVILVMPVVMVVIGVILVVVIGVILCLWR
jgi:hypothetical protein